MASVHTHTWPTRVIEGIIPNVLIVGRPQRLSSHVMKDKFLGELSRFHDRMTEGEDWVDRIRMVQEREWNKGVGQFSQLFGSFWAMCQFLNVTDNHKLHP